MSILGRIGNHLGNRMRQLPGGNAVGNALGKSPVMGRLPGVRPPSPAQGLGPSPNALQGMAGPLAGMGGDMGPQRPPDAPPMMGPVPEGPQNTGVTGGMTSPPPDAPVAKPMMEPQGGMGPNPAMLQQMIQKKQMMDRDRQNQMGMRLQPMQIPRGQM